jgi:diguanylate cyclase (GGDEF)-like protein/PAS domain S-box-containing protein
LLSEYNRVRLAQEKTAEQLQKITNNIPGLIYQFRLNLDGSYCFPYANQGMESVYGVSAEQAQENANTIFDLIHPDDYGGLVASITDSAQHLSPWQYIYRVYHKDGTMRWLSGHSIPQREADGAILWHGFIRDISEFKHKEIEYQTVIEASINGFWSNDFSGCFLTVNSALCNILGYSEQELLNMTVMDIEAAENTEETATHFQKIIQTGHDTFETRHQRKDARIIDVEVNVLYVESLGQRFFVFINDITERKQSQKALATSEEKYRTLFDSIQDGIVYVDMQGTILECNQCYSDMLGYSEEELKKITFHQVTPEKWYALEAEMIEKEVINRGYCDLFEKEYIRKDGTVFPIELRAWLAKDKNGHNQGMWAIIRDITKRKLVERYLQKNQALLQTAQRAARMGHYVADLRTPNTMTWTNDTLLDEIYGVDQQFPHTLLNWKSLIHPDDLEEVMQIFQELFTNHSRFPDKNSMDSISYRIIRPNDGETRWTETWAYNFYDDNGVIFQQVGMVQDITERKLAEIDLRIAATVFEAQEGMMIADAHCIILNVNHAFTLITGYSASESIGKTPHFLQSGRHDKAFYDALWQSIYDTGAWQGEIWDRRKNGEIFPQWLTITAVKDKNGTVVSHYVSTLTDITERKATEETINRLAFYDPLTHLPNRRLLQERLKHGIEISHRTGSLMAVIMMDLDRFKAVNDSLGHAAGDALLQQVAERIKNRLREVDMVARLGGDEFVIVIDAVEQCSDVERVAEAIIHTLSQPFVLYEIHQVSIGTSIGIALHPQHGDSPEILLDNADMALYHAKNQGRGCFAHFSDALRKK